MCQLTTAEEANSGTLAPITMDEVIVIDDGRGDTFTLISDPPESPPAENEAARRVEPAGRVTTSVETQQLPQADAPVNIAGIRSLEHAKANSGFAWFQKKASDEIRASVTGMSKAVALATYHALCELDSLQGGNPKSPHRGNLKGTVVASKKEIATLAGCCPKAVYMAVSELERIGVVRVHRKKKLDSKCHGYEENRYELLAMGSNQPKTSAPHTEGGRSETYPIYKEAPLLKKESGALAPAGVDAGASAAGTEAPGENGTARHRHPKRAI